MKSRLLVIIAGIIVGTGIMMFTFDGEYNNATNNAYGMWRPLSSEALIEESKTIFVGTITAITPVDVEYQSQIARDGTNKDGIGPEVMTLEEYTVSVEEYLKNIQDLDTLKVLSATVGGVPSGPARISGFEIGDRVLFYLPNDENQTHFANQYLPESFKIPKHCNAKTVLEQPRIDGANDFRMMQDRVAMQDNFTANKKIQFIFDKDMRTLDGAGFSVDVAISKVLGKNDYQSILKESIRVESQTCEWITTAQWDFVPTAGEYNMWMKYGKEGDSGYTTGGSSFSVVNSALERIMPHPENDAYPYVSNGLSKLQKAVREDISIGNYQFNDVVHGGGIANNNLYISVNPEITDPAEQEEIFLELVILLGFDSFEIDFVKPIHPAKASCESSEMMLVDGICQKIVVEDPSRGDAPFFGIFVYLDDLISWIFGK